MPLVPAGRVLETRLDTKLDGKLCKPGDVVQLTLVYPLAFETPAGAIRVPQGAGVHGHVVLAAERPTKSGKSQLAFVIDSVTWGQRTAMVSGIVLGAKEPQPEAGLRVPEPSADRGPFDPRSTNPLLLRRTRLPSNSR